MPKMGVDPEATKAPKPVPNGWYKLKFKGFKQKVASKKDSVNYNAQLEIVENKPDYNGKPVYMGLNTKMARSHVDFSHGLGFALKPDGDYEGQWVFDPADPENVEKAQYKGPLLGRVLEAELITTTYQGNERNEVKQIRCVVPQCATKYPEIKHMTDMIGKNSTRV